jgi:hypothetical protein
MPDLESAIASTYVEPRGAGRALVAKVAGGQALGAVGYALAGAAARTDKSPVKLGKLAYLAVFPDELVLFGAKAGAFKPKPTEEIVASMPRSAVASAQLDRKAIKGVLTISFAGGETWEFDMPRVHMKTAEGVVQVLT